MAKRKIQPMEKHGADTLQIIENNHLNFEGDRLARVLGSALLDMMVEQSRMEYKLDIAHRRIDELEKSLNTLWELTGYEVPIERDTLDE